MSKRLAKNDIEIKILTGCPSYALKIKNCPEKEFYKKREIVRTRYANFWPKRFYGRLINSILFTIFTGIKLFRKRYSGKLTLFTSEPPFLPIFGWLISFLINSLYINNL